MSVRTFEHFPPDEGKPQLLTADQITPLSVVQPPIEPEIFVDTTAEMTAEEKAKAEKRQLILQDFYSFAQDKHNIDPKTTDPKEEHDLALVIHDYAWSRTGSLIAKKEAQHKADPSVVMPNIRLIDYKRINDKVNIHYRTFGEDRQTLNNIERREEEVFLSAAKKRASAFIYGEKDPNLDGTGTPSTEARRGIPRYLRYPEIMLVMELREALIAEHTYVAAKSAEVTFAAYGSIFPALVRENAIHTLSDEGHMTRLIKKAWGEQELPPDELADKAQRRKPKL